MAGYLLAAASFLALGATLRSGVHIRVTMVLSVLGEAVRRRVETLAFAVTFVAAGYVTWYVTRLAFDSWVSNEIPPALLPIPLVYPRPWRLGSS
jgi:TRAP-type C4-dicarboxylate transport system permease small subunit